jgi:hypothetical protein
MRSRNLVGCLAILLWGCTPLPPPVPPTPDASDASPAPPAPTPTPTPTPPPTPPPAPVVDASPPTPPPVVVDAGPPSTCSLACSALQAAGCTLGGQTGCLLFMNRDIASGKVRNPSTNVPLTCAAIAKVTTKAQGVVLGFSCP